MGIMVPGSAGLRLRSQELKNVTMEDFAMQNELTFGDIARSYEEAIVPRMAIATQCVVRRIINNYLIPQWGEQPALKLCAFDIETWVGSLSLANSSKTQIRWVICRVYLRAQKHGLIPANEPTPYPLN